MKKSITKKAQRLEPLALYDEAQALGILGISKQEFDRLNSPEFYLSDTGEVVYRAEDLWPYVYGEEFPQNGKIR